MALLALLAVTVLAAGSAQAVSGRSETSIEKYPAVAQVEFRLASGLWYQSCAGNILTSRHLVTAAQCFHGATYSPESRRVRAGSSTRNEGGSVVYVEREFNHPTFGLLDFDGDISVVRLLDPLVYGETIAPSPILPQGFAFPPNIRLNLAGWGTTSYQTQTVIQEHLIYSVSHEECKEIYGSLSIPSTVTENMICGRSDDGSSVCEGDLGGPVFYYDEDNVENPTILVGVISWGNSCVDGDFPGVGTDIAQYSDWIIATVV